MNILEIFTVIGSILGIIAFLQNFIGPISDINKTKWNRLQNEINDIDFDNIAYSLWHQHRIDPISQKRLERLIYNIERNAEELHFKTIFKNKCNSHFKKIREQYIQWRTLVQVPFWEPRGQSSEETAWTLNNSAFYEYAIETGREDDYLKADKKYREHLEKAHDLVNEMRKEFREISVLANTEVHEILLPWTRSNKSRSRITS